MSDLSFTGRQQVVQTITGFQKRVGLFQEHTCATRPEGYRAGRSGRPEPLGAVPRASAASCRQCPPQREEETEHVLFRRLPRGDQANELASRVFPAQEPAKRVGLEAGAAKIQKKDGRVVGSFGPPRIVVADRCLATQGGVLGERLRHGSGKHGVGGNDLEEKSHGNALFVSCRWRNLRDSSVKDCPAAARSRSSLSSAWSDHPGIRRFRPIDFGGFQVCHRDQQNCLSAPLSPSPPVRFTRDRLNQLFAIPRTRDLSSPGPGERRHLTVVSLTSFL